jgi:two-component system, OmpR family, alkaline phosphatase synthesis response regulator PhoP
MQSEHVLIVDDEEDILELLRYNLSKDGYRVTGVTNGEDALRVAERDRPDAVILDLMLPSVDGYGVCERLKKNAETRDIPIVMLTAKGEEADIVKGLEKGADDYVTKPFSPRVLLARIKAVLRRSPRTEFRDDSEVARGTLKIHPGRHEVFVDGQPISLTFTEFQILVFLASRPGWVFTRLQIIDEVRGDNYPVTDRSVDVHIVSLRRKLGAAGAYVETVRGIGYRFREV